VFAQVYASIIDDKTDHGATRLFGDFLALLLHLFFPIHPNVVGVHGAFRVRCVRVLLLRGGLASKRFDGCGGLSVRRCGWQVRKSPGFAASVLFRPIFRDGTRGVMQPFFVLG